LGSRRRHGHLQGTAFAETVARVTQVTPESGHTGVWIHQVADRVRLSKCGGTGNLPALH
jgi:CDGSH-type Zn-finger protein